jgi:site-specific DNA-methyltransferase (adenine-specific)
MAAELIHGDCLTEMAAMKAAGRTFDSIVTDPPYHLTEVPHVPLGGFGGQRSDAKRAARGGFMNAKWDGGDIAFRPETWRLAYDLLEPGGMLAAFGGSRTHHRIMCAIEDAGFEIRDVCLWLHSQGFPKSKALLKPSYEPIILARKPGPLRPLAIDACRVGTGDDRTSGGNPSRADFSAGWGMASTQRATGGRWPSNILHDGSPEVLAAFARFGELRARGNKLPETQGSTAGQNVFGKFARRQVEPDPGDAGTAARFYPALGFGADELRFCYAAKASRKERGGTTHPTTKPVSVVSWLVRLINPPGGTVLDCFSGSGTTGVACLREGFDCVLIEKEAEYVEMIKSRLRQERARQQGPREQDPQLALAIS